MFWRVGAMKPIYSNEIVVAPAKFWIEKSRVYSASNNILGPLETHNTFIYSERQKDVVTYVNKPIVGLNIIYLQIQ